MDQTQVATHSWPESRQLMAALSGTALDLVVISVATPYSPLRHVARLQLRTALREVLGLQLNCAPESILLTSRPGQVIRVALPSHGIGIGLSVGHEAGISVAAIHQCGPVGIDILRLPEEFDWYPVTRDYMGRQVLARIAALPPDEQPPAFAREWTRFEAGLKCLGVGLQEWNFPLAQRLESCRFLGLKLPAGLFGTVACRYKHPPLRAALMPAVSAYSAVQGAGPLTASLSD